jgi:uncharacterized protein
MLSKERLMSFISNRFLELIILPTEQCNFRCVYCYEDFSIGKMKRNTVEAIKKLILNRINTIDMLKISWFGGEPLAAKDIVYEISDFIMQLCKKYPSLKYISSMTTNAFQLKKEILLKLVSLGIKNYQISLDGTAEKHDQTRIRMNGAGTFQTIWSNLLAAKETDLDFSIILRIHVTPENIEDIYYLVDQIKSTFGYDKRFSIFFKAIENLGGPNTGTFEVIHGQDKRDILANLNRYLGEMMIGKKLSENGCYVCYAAQTNSFVIRADGKVGKCTVALSDDRNILGELRDNGTLEISSNKLALWTRGLKSEIEEELSCPMRSMSRTPSALQSIPVVIK